MTDRHNDGIPRTRICVALVLLLHAATARPEHHSFDTSGTVRLRSVVLGANIDSLFVRDTVRKLMNVLMSPRVSLSKRTTNDLFDEGGTRIQRTVREEYVLEMTDPHLLRTTLQLSGLDDASNESRFTGLHIEEFQQVHAHPMLGFVFFDANSAELPARYERISQREAKAYRLDDLYDRDDIGVHHNILNIIGRRLLDHPTATVTLTGCNADVDAERGNLDLSQSRAEAVKGYLTTVWGINPARIKTRARGLPEFASSSRSPDGQDENRRVEITSNHLAITQVFTASDTSRVPVPSGIRFKTSYQSASPLQSWTLQVLQSGKPVKSFSNQGPPPNNIDWDLAGDEVSLAHISGPLEASLSLKNSLGDVTVTSVPLPTTARTLKQKQIEHVPDTTIDKYNLVLFNFGKAELTPAHDEVISVIKSRLKAGSQITIEGFTDRTGSAASNVRLANSRAQATKKALGREDAVILGAADERLLYPNDTPEGRFLCRVVQITVRTPMH